MRRTLHKRGLRAIVAGAGVAALMLATASTAFAAPSDPIDPNLLDKGTPATADDVIIALAGSDTLEFVTQDIIDTFPASVIAKTYSVQPGPHLVSPVTVPGDANCGVDMVFDSTEPSSEYLVDTNANGKAYPPNGSSQGRSALKESANPATNYFSATAEDAVKNGCIDVARSSGAPKTSDPAEFEYYGFALDSLSWGTTSLNAPNQLTLAQVRDIFRCELETTAGVDTGVDADPYVNNWAEVGGAPGQITRVVPQNGSGTGEFFKSNVLGFDPTAIDPDGPGGTACPTTVEVQENDGTQLLTSANEARYNEYIIGYSAGKWVYQVTNKANPTLDLRGGVRVGAIVRDSGETCPTAPKTFVNANNAGAFPVRYDGAGYLLNAGTVICSNSATVDTALFGTTLTAAPGTFSSTDLGLVVSGPGIVDGTVITSVTGGGATANLSAVTLAAQSGVSVEVGIPVVSEFNPNITDPASAAIYPGVRELYHVLDTRSSNYDEGLALFGFEAGTAGKSPLCNGGNVGEILANGFLNLTAVDNNGTTSTTCRLL